MAGFYILAEGKYITIPAGGMPVAATLLGSLLFGIGMGLAGCCVTGQLFRASQGLISAWLTLLVFTITTVATQTGVLKFWAADLLKNPSTLATIPGTLQVSPLWFIVPFVVLAVIACVKAYREEKKEPDYWRSWVSGIALGIVGLAAWPLSADAGRDFGLSFTIPLGNLLQFITLDQQRYLNWGTYLVIGIFAGAFGAALLKKQWRKDVLTVASFGNSVTGGFLMGVGAALTGGCTMANVIVGTAYFSWQSWIASFVMVAGMWLVGRVRRSRS